MNPDDDIAELSSRFADLILNGGTGAHAPNDRALARSATALIGADLFGLYVLDDRLAPRDMLISRPLGGFLSGYEKMRTRDPIFLHVLRKRQAIDGVSLLGQEKWQRHPLARFMHDWNLDYSLQGGVFIGGRPVATINAANNRVQGSFSPAQRATLERLCQAVSERISARRAQRCGRITVGPPERLPIEQAIVTDRSGRGTTCAPPRRIAAAIRAGIALIERQQGGAIERDIVVEGGRHRLLTTRLGEGPHYVSILMPAERTVRDIPAALDPLDDIAPRTRAVLDRLVRGYSNKLIARELGITDNTVKDHIRRIYRHFGTRSRTELTWILHGQD